MYIFFCHTLRIAPSFKEYQAGKYLLACTNSSLVGADIVAPGKGSTDILLIRIEDKTVPKCCLARWWHSIFK
jgi:hypothetical protein